MGLTLSNSIPGDPIISKPSTGARPEQPPTAPSSPRHVGGSRADAGACPGLERPWAGLQRLQHPVSRSQPTPEPRRQAEELRTLNQI